MNAPRLSLDSPSLAIGAMLGFAAAHAADIAHAAMVAASWGHSGVPVTVSVTAAAALAAGAAWVAFSPAKVDGVRRWTLAVGGPDDFVAFQRLAYPFLPKGWAAPPPLKAAEFLEARLGQAPFTVDGRPMWPQEAVRRVLEEQLGERLDGVAAAPLSFRVMAALFACAAARNRRGFDGVRDRAAAAFDGGTPEMVAALETEVSAVLSEPQVASFIGRRIAGHAYITTAGMALRAAARSYGAISAAEFLWLKSVDRTLFYAITSEGRPSVLSEGLAATAHYAAERAAGAAIVQPQTTEAEVVLCHLLRGRA